MYTETFDAGITQRVSITDSHGAIVVQFWDANTFELTSTGDTAVMSRSDAALIIHAAHSDLRLRVPAATAFDIENHKGDLRIESCDSSVRLRDIDGSVFVAGAAQLTIERDELLRQRHGWLQRTRRDIEVRSVGSVAIAAVPGNLTLFSVEHANIGMVGGSVQAQAIANHLELGPVGGSCTVDQVGGNVLLGAIGGSCRISAVSGSVRTGTVGGSAELRATGALQSLGSIGGSAQIELPAQANMCIRALVGGRIRAPGISAGPGWRTLVFGDGSAQINITVGGSLTLI